MCKLMGAILPEPLCANAKGSCAFAHIPRAFTHVAGFSMVYGQAARQEPARQSSEGGNAAVVRQARGGFVHAP
jgi:hypothetical protein